MNEQIPQTDEQLPPARVGRRHKAPSIVWLLPVVAAIVAGYLVYDRIKDFGPTITVRFKDGNGIRSGQTQIKYRGVPIGEVTSIGLSSDQKYALVRIRLDRSAKAIARSESQFWIVRPEFDIGNITGLTTVISGPEIRVQPGSGEPRSEFVGLERAPPAFEGRALKVVLRTDRPGSLRRNSPVYYRGVEVGVVYDIALGSDASQTDIHALIRPRYADLVRRGSVFWNVSGAHISAGLFKGVDIKVESVRSLLAGGISFATPNDSAAARVKDGTVFPLHPEPSKEWLTWAPHIVIPPEVDIAAPTPHQPEQKSSG